MIIASKFWRSLVCSLYIGAGAAHAQAEPQLQSLQAIRAAAENFVRRQLQGDPQAAILTAASLDTRLRLAKCAAPLATSLPQGAQLQARTAVGVSCREGATWTVYVPVTVESEVNVFVLKAAAARGARISPEDCTVQQRKVSGFASSYVTDARVLAGHTLKRSVPAGTALTPDVLVADFLVKRGEQVTLLASTGSFEVRAYGRALSDGQDGGRIKAQNLSSLRVVEGVVDGRGVIRVAP